MRAFIPLMLILVAVAFAGCSSNPRVVEAETGPGFSRLHDVYEVHVLPVRLPDRISGQGGGEHNDQWHKTWPNEAARYVADGITDRTMSRIMAVADVEKPRHGIYVEIVVRDYDVGARELRPPVHTVGGRADWSRVLADAYIYDATTGELCARLDIDQSSGAGDVLEADMTEIGKQIGAWLDRLN